MDSPTTGIAGRTRSRRSSVAPTSPSWPPVENGRLPRARLRTPKRRNAATVFDGGDREGAGSRGGGEEGRGRGAADGRPPFSAEKLPVARRTRSRLSHIDAASRSQSQDGRSPADGGPSGLGDDGTRRRGVQVHMANPAAGIAGRTRSRLASLAPTSPSSSSVDNGQPVWSRLRSRKHRNAEFVLDNGNEEGASARAGGDERRGTGHVDGRRPPLEEFPVANRTRSKLSSFDAASRSNGSISEEAGPSNLGDDGGLESREVRGRCDVGLPPYVGSNVLAMLSSLGAAVDISDSENSEEEEPTPSPPSGIAGGTIAEGGGGEGEGEAEVAPIPMKRKKFCGIDVLIPSRGSSSTEELGIAKRTRSHFASESREQWQKQPGTLRSPYCVDMDFSETGSETHSSSSSPSDHDHEDDDDGRSDVTSIHLPGSAIGDEAAGAGGGRKQGQPKPLKPCMGRKRGRRPMRIAAGRSNLCRVFLDGILQKDGESPRETSKPRELPLLFSFGDEDPCNPAVEKSEFGQALDSLWSEFDFAMRVTELGSSCDYVCEDEESSTSGTEAAPPGLCSQANHKLILDDQIGVRCEHCSFVELEIRYVPPSFETRSCWAISNKKTLWDEDISMLRALGDEAAGGQFDSPTAGTKGTVWDFVDPGVKGSLFPHQREGLEFIWRNMAGDILVDKVKNAVSSDAVLGGCVITHAPGTGKTRLAIVFLETFLRLFPRCRPVVLAPRGMLLTWEKEFKKCGVGFPFHILNDMQRTSEGHGAGNGAAELYRQRGRASTMTRINVDRLVRLHSWATRGDGVLGISYGLFGRLAGKSSEEATEEEEKLGRVLLELPGLFIFDEGHVARNERSSIWQVLQRIRTRCRVILSGTPFQNNLRELENVLCLVRPELSGKVSTRRARRTCKRAGAGLSTVRTSAEREMEELSQGIPPLPGASWYTQDSIEELRSMIRPYVHIHSGSVLENLPGLRDCLVFLNPPTHQKDLLRRVQKFPWRNYLDYEFKASLASLHPSLLASAAKLSKEEASVVGHNLLQLLRDEKSMSNPREGVKTLFVVELVRLCASLGEKVLVFSRYKEPLPYLREQLLRALGWDEGRVLQMDGGLSPGDRQSRMDAFNAPGSEVQVLLASIRACCEGISLVGASRVVLLDTVWNPSVERQAVSRAYRIGQQRVVFTYHLIAAETEELERYRRQVEKDRISELVLPSRGVCKSGEEEGGDQSRVLEDRILKEMREHEKLRDMFKHVVDNPRKAMPLLDAFDPWPAI